MFAFERAGREGANDFIEGCQGISIRQGGFARKVGSSTLGVFCWEDFGVKRVSLLVGGCTNSRK